MKRIIVLLAVLVMFCSITTGVLAADKKNDAPVGYTNTPFIPNSEWRVHDINRPAPAVITPGSEYGKPPSDAVVLFSGKAEELSKWQTRDKDIPIPNSKKKKPGPVIDGNWKVENGYMECGPKSMWTKEVFGSCQLHVEWQIPEDRTGKTHPSQKGGNSGVFLMKRYEVQVLNAYQNRTYSDGSAGSLYGQYPPLVNAAKKPGEWQAYDIIFEAPEFKGNKLIKPAYITVLYNGVVVQHRKELIGATTHKKVGTYKPHPEKDSIQLQAHGNPTHFRNIWIRPLKDYDEQ